MADTAKVERRAVLLTGIDQLSPKLAGLRATVERFQQSLADTGLGTLDVAGLVKGEGLAAPFVDGVRSALAFQEQVAQVNRSTQGLELPRLPADTAQALNAFGDSTQRVSVAFGAALLPAVSAVAVGFEPLLAGVAQVLVDNPQLVQGLASGVGAFTAIQGAVAGASQALELASLALGATPFTLIAMGIALAAGLIVANWQPLSAFFVGLWQKIAPVVLPMAAFFKTLFAFTPMGQVLANWGPISGFLASLWQGISTAAQGLMDGLKSLFSFSPLGLVMANWTPLTGLFAALWALLQALAVPVMGFLRELFNWSPLGLVIANWGSIGEVFSALWGGIQAQALAMYAVLGSVFDWSPLGLITQHWEPVTEWFASWWQKLQGVLAPFREMLGGSVGGFIAKITGEVQGLTEQQLKRNQQGEGAPAAGFFGASASTSAPSLTASSHLPQGASALVQQSAANHRAQVEGGLTVRFENAPPGLRVDPPRSNQPGLNLTPRVGYRSLSLGGSNELA